MTIDFSPIRNNEAKLSEFVRDYTKRDLVEATNYLYSTIAEIIHTTNDAQIIFIPDDPDANDPYAPPGEQHAGWSLGHLVAHVTASTEEAATFGSILARGISYGREPRLRYETPWRTITTKAHAIGRLEESRRMVLALLETWPDEPHLQMHQTISERAAERFGSINAIGAHLLGLMHMEGHIEQFREAARQAREATQAVSAD